MKYLNEAGWDRILRVLAGIVLLVLGFGGVLTGGWGLAAEIIGIILLVTGLVGFCPIYYLLKIRTKKTSD